MKKMIFAAVTLVSAFAWATPAFNLRIISYSTGDQIMFSGNYDEDVYSCILELSEIQVSQNEIRATIDDSSPRRCYYIEAPDYGYIDLTKLGLAPNVYKVIINGVAQGSVDASQLQLGSPEDVLEPQLPEYF